MSDRTHRDADQAKHGRRPLGDHVSVEKLLPSAGKHYRVTARPGLRFRTAGPVEKRNQALWHIAFATLPAGYCAIAAGGLFPESPVASVAAGLVAFYLSLIAVLALIFFGGRRWKEAATNTVDVTDDDIVLRGGQRVTTKQLRSIRVQHDAESYQVRVEVGEGERVVLEGLDEEEAVLAADEIASFVGVARVRSSDA